jgi:hypothetical protein
LRTVDICAGQSKTISCYDLSPQHTVFIANAFFGVKKGTFCGYSPGDCTQEEMYNDCNSSETTCKISVTSFKFMSNCGFLSRASYYHLDYYCVPFQVASEETHVCSLVNVVSNERGIIQGPYTPNLFCDKTLTVPAGQSVNLWFLNMKIGGRDANGNCQGDYVKITDSTGEYVHCGSERVEYRNTFCSNVVYVSYRTGNKVIKSLFYDICFPWLTKIFLPKIFFFAKILFYQELFFNQKIFF